MMENDKSAESPQQFQTVESRDRIHSMLNQCAKQQVDLHISLNRKGELYTTQIEKLDLAHDSIYLSELMPKMGQRLLRGINKMRIFTHINGTEINFEVAVMRVKSALFRTRNCVQYPKTIRYFQRRRAHRVHISIAMDVHASLNSLAGDSYHGQIRDLSASGMRLQFYRVKPSSFEQHDLSQECIINLPDEENIRCRFTVHHVQQHDSHRGFAVGGSFTSMNHEQKKTLQRFLAKVEHQSLRAYR